ncbi:hypothetical protein IGI04_037915 [Brassica rapa subsp. trilocularis]|uniref:Uncharacterized protein n=1 Tax=Brassica rapa subsp. trilocularis TaxID=1813537 RepID=A0ABQ7LIQ4_BRACM|nr:hypothetical protein IGI04_037915 [Brassica rapa subsp. trilocularis]
MEVQAEMQPSSSIRQMGYTSSKGVDLASAKRLLPVSNFYNANVAFALGRLQSNNSGSSNCNY